MDFFKNLSGSELRKETRQRVLSFSHQLIKDIEKEIREDNLAKRKWSLSHNIIGGVGIISSTICGVITFINHINPFLLGLLNFLALVSTSLLTFYKASAKAEKIQIKINKSKALIQKIKQIQQSVGMPNFPDEALFQELSKISEEFSNLLTDKY